MESEEIIEQMGTDRDPGDQKPTTPQPRDPKMQVARILLPDGAYKEFEVNKNSEGEALFHQVTQNLSIEEHEYFSLCFYDKEEGIRHWLYNDKAISKQIKGLPWEFSFEVKFYPTTPTTIVDDHARYFVFLQLRRDLLTGRLPVANADTHALLGSFVAQMEFGDAPAHIADEYEKFITSSKLVPSTHATPESFAKIAELHRELRGRTTAEAEMMFLDHCRHLPLYGIHIFKATDKDKKHVDVGIGAAGVNIYQDEQTAHSFIWQNIIKIGYKRTYFSVKVKSGTIGKDEKTLYYKLPSHDASKRTWKCAVEHHTFFRLIQPEEKKSKGFFNFGSQRFRYQGRTQFQTKIASQMFDKPSTVDRAPSAMSQPIASAEDQKLQVLNLTDSELEQRNFERYRRALTPKSYTSGSRQDDDAISTATFAKYSRPSTLLVVNTSHQQHDLSYSPRDDSSNYSSAAYYMSERSSLRTPSSAYYPPSEYTSPTSPHYFEGQHSGEYHVQMRQSTSAGAGTGARRNLFGRASDARSSRASRDSVRLVSFHEPVDPNEPIPNTYPVNELPQIPIERIVHVYHEGRYERLSPRRQQRPELPYGFGNYTPRNGVSHVDNLEPDGEMVQEPIRFYVDVRHSGASRRDPTKRLSHPGKEDVKEKIDPKDYVFSAASTSDPPLYRTELGREVPPTNIHQYSRRYHIGEYSQLPEAPQYRLITTVHPLVVSTREDTRNGQSSSNVTATISQREQVVSTKVRRESPDADRRVRLSASVDRSGNLTDTTEEMARSSTTTTEVTTTTTTVVTTADTVETAPQKKAKKQKKQKIPPSSKPASSSTTQETRSRFGGFFTKKSTKSDYPTGELSGDIDTTARSRELEASDFEHPKIKTATIVTQSFSSTEHRPGKKEKRSLIAVETPEVPKKYRLIARTRHEGEEEVGDKPEAYDFSSDVHQGPVEDISRQSELIQVPIREYSDVKHDVEAESVSVVEKKQKKEKSPKKAAVPVLSEPAEPTEPEKKEVRLIARVRTEPEAEPVKEKKPKKEKTTGLFGRSAKYNITSESHTGELDTTDRTHDLEPLPFEHTQTPTTSPHHATKKFTLFGRLRHEGAEEVVEKPDPYAFASTSYEGPFHEVARQSELEHAPIRDYSDVKHSGESWNYVKSASPVFEKKGKKEKKSPKKAAPAVVVTEEPEKKEVRLIARVRTEPQEEPTPAEKPKKTSSSKFGFFSRSTKSTKTTTGYPESSDAFTGQLDTTDRSHDLDSSPFDHPDYPAYKPRNDEAYQPSEHSSRHEEDVVEAPAAYGFPSTSYDGPIETTVLERDLEHLQSPFPMTVVEKSSKGKENVALVAGSPEKKEVRLVARVLPNEPAVQTKEKSSKSKLGFFSKKTAKHPEPMEAFTGQLEDTSRTEDLESSPFSTTRIISETDPVVSHEKKRYRLLARLRHEGEEDIAEKPESYAPTKTMLELYEGPLNEMSHESQLEHAPIRDYSDVHHSGESWNYVKPAPVPVKKQKKSKLPKKMETAEPVEPETKEVRLIARVVKESDEVETAEPKEKKTASKSKIPTFGFFSRTTKSTKTTGYPESSDAYTGELDTTIRSDEFEGISFEHGEIPAYAPKKIGNEEPVIVTEPEKVRTYWFARWIHDGEEDVADKPDAYAPSENMLDLYEGPLEEISNDSELLHAPLRAYSDVHHSGESWNYVKPSPVATLEKKEKKIKSPKKEKVAEPEEPEIKDVRLIARVKSETEEELVSEPIVKEKSPKRVLRISKETGYPITSEEYSGELDSTSPSHELERSTFEHGDIPAYSPKKAETPEVFTLEKKEKKVKSPKKEKVVEPEEPEAKEVRLIARVKSEPVEELLAEPVVKEKKPKKEKSSKSGIFSRTTKATKTTGYPESSDAYTGPLDTTDRSQDLEKSDFEHADIPAYSPKKAEVETPVVPAASSEEPEKKEIRLIAYVKSEPEDQAAEPVVQEKKPKKEKSSKSGFFSRTTKATKTTGYPETSDAYTGELDTTARSQDLEESEFEHVEHPDYLPKNVIVEAVQVKPHSEMKRYRLITRFRHEGEEDVVESPESYNPSDSMKGFYDGELSEISHDSELEHAPIREHTDVYHTGESWNYVKPTATPEKKVKSPKKEKVVEPVTEKPKKESSKIKFFSKTPKTTLSPGYPETSDAYTGEVDTTVRLAEFEPASFEHRDYPKYKPFVLDDTEIPPLPVVTLEKKQFRLITRLRRSEETPMSGGYPEATKALTEQVDTTDRTPDLEGTSFEHPEVPAYSVPKESKKSKLFGFFSRKTTEEPSHADRPEVTAEPKKERAYWFARWRHEGDEEVAEKPDAYKPSEKLLDLYEGPLDEIGHGGELVDWPIEEFAEVYHSGESWNYVKPSPVATLEKKEKKVKSPKKEKSVEPEEPETREVRLIARVKSETEEDLAPEPVVKEKKPKKTESKSKIPTFGFFHRTQEPSVSHFPTSEPYTGALDTTELKQEIESSPFDHPEYPAYSPRQNITESVEVPAETEKKRFHWFARWRHEGEEDVADKPDAYKPSENLLGLYEGPLDEIAHDSELEHAPIHDHSGVYHSGESWNYVKPSPVATLEKKEKKIKSPKKEVAEPEEPEVKEVRLIARIKSETEEDLVAEPVVKEKSPKRVLKISKETGYPITSEEFSGELDSTSPTHELESSAFEHGDIPAYSPKKAETPEVSTLTKKEKKVKSPKKQKVVEPEEPEKKEIRLIAHIKSEPEDESAEPVAKENSPKKVAKASGYPSASEQYTGELDSTSPSHELESTSFEHGDYPAYSPKKADTPEVSTLTKKKEKKIKSLKKEKIAEPEVPETKEVRLIARIKTEPEEEPVGESLVEKPKKEKSKSKIPTFGFFSRTTKTTKTTGYPETSDAYAGELDTTDRTHDLEGTSFDHGEYPAYSPKKRSETPEDRVIPVEEKKYRLIARFRHDGDEDVVEKPEFYNLSPELYSGPLQETSYVSELDHTPINDHCEIREYVFEEPVTPTEPGLPATREVRLITLVRTEPEEQAVEEIVKEKKPKKESSKSKLPAFGFFSKTTKTTGYPETSDAYTGELDTTDRAQDLEKSDFEHGEFPAYAPKKIKTEVPEVPAEPEKKRYRLIARWRHEGEEDVADKPDVYNPSDNLADLYEGPLEDISRESELEHAPIRDFSDVQYSGESWNYVKPASPVATLEKKEKKIKSPKKEKVVEPEEPETREVRLIARIRTEPEVEPAAEPVIKEKKPKKEKSSKAGFFSKTTKTTKATGYPETSEAYTGALDTTDRSQDLEKSDFEHVEIPTYAPKKTETTVTVIETTETTEPEKKDVRLIAYVKSEPEEPVAEPVVKEKKPKKEGSSKFGFFSKTTKTTKTTGYPETSDVFTGELDTTDPTHEFEGTSFEHPEYPAYAPQKIEVETPEVSAEPEKKRYRLIARFRHEGEEDIAEKPDAYKPSDNILELYEGPLEDISRESELEHAPIRDYSDVQYSGESWNYVKPSPAATLEKKEKKIKSPKKEKVAKPEEPETREVRLIARVRTETEEELAPEPIQKKRDSKSKLPGFGFFHRTSSASHPSSEQYTGQLESTDRELDIETTPFEHPDIPAYSPKKTESPEVPAEPEKRRFNWFARWRHEGEEDVVDISDAYAPSKTMLDLYHGPLDEIALKSELEHSPIHEHSGIYHSGESWNYVKPSPVATLEKKEKKIKSPKKEKVAEPEVPEVKEVRLIARVKSNTEEDFVSEPVVKEKKLKKEKSSKSGIFSRPTRTTKATGYPETSEAYTGELDTTARTHDMEGTSFEHGEIPAYASKKAEVETAEPNIVEPVESERTEIRLFAYVKPHQEEDLVAEPVVKEKKPKSSKLGFFSKTTKTTKTTGYPETSDAYTGELDTTDRSSELESSPFEHPEYPAYKPLDTELSGLPEAVTEKKRYRLIARFRHEGEEDVVEKPDAYGFPTDVHVGPIDDIHRIVDLNQVPIRDYSDVKHSGVSWNVEELTAPVATMEKKQKKAKSPKKEKAVEPEEPEAREVRLIARVRTEPEDEAEPVVEEKKPKKDVSKSKLPTFGFFSRTTKTTKTTGYPETSDAYTGELDTTDRTHDLEGTSFEHPEYPAYAPKKIEVETPEVPAEPEKKRYRLIARWRHEGEEDVADKPDAYSPSENLAGLYEGPLEDIARESELEHAPIRDFSDVQYSGESWNYVKPASPVATLEKKEKKIKSPKKEKIVEPEEPETKEVRLIARVRTETEEELAPEPIQKKRDSKSKLPGFGFFHRTSSASHPSSEQYTGQLESTDRELDIETTPFEHPDIPAYSPKKAESPEVPAEPEKRRFNWFARWRHEGEEDVVDISDAYAPSKTMLDLYHGPLDEIARKSEIEHSPIHEHSGVYHSGESWNYVKPSPVATLEKKEKKIESPKKEKVAEPEVPEVKEVRLIARIRTETEEDLAAEPVVKEKKTKKEKSSKSGIFSRTTRTTKATGYPETSDAYTGELDTTARSDDLEKSDFEHADIPAYAPKKLEVESSDVPAPVEPAQEPEKKEIRLIAYVKPEPEEEAVALVVKEKKPKKEGTSKFGFFSKTTKTTKATGYPETSDAFTGELDTTDRSYDLEKSDFEHADIPVYSPKQSDVPTQEEPAAESEKKRYRLIARFQHEGEEDVVHKPDPYAFESTLYEGPMEEISRENELDHAPIEDHSEVRREEEPRQEEPTAHVLALTKKDKKVKSPKKEKAAEPVEPEKKEVRLIARVRTEPEDEAAVEPVVKEKKPKRESSGFGFFSRTTKTVGYPETSDAYTGELDSTDRTHDLEGTSFEHPEYPAYAPKKTETPEVHEVSAEPEKKRYRLIARFRHEGEEDVADKPDVYNPSDKMAELYEGPLEDIARESELEHAPIRDFSDVQYSGESWNYVKPASPVATLEKKEKKTKSPKKEKVVEPEEPETKEVRLIARVKSEPEEDVAEPVVKEKKPKKESSGFGFFSKKTRTTKTTGYPESSETYTGELDTTARSQDLEKSDFEHGEIPAYSPKTLESPNVPELPTEPEKKRYRLIARWRHEGEEDIAEKPDAYKPSDKMLELYEGPLEDISRESELEHVPIRDFSDVQHSGESWNYVKPSPVATLEKKEKKIKSPKKDKFVEPEEPETKEVRLIARVRTETEEELAPEPIQKKRDSKSKLPGFGFFHRTSSAPHPSSEQYTGQLESTDRELDIETTPFEHPDIPAYSPKKDESPEVPAEPEKRRFNWFARWRHEGEEDLVDISDAYAPSKTMLDLYHGPLDEIALKSELEHSPIHEHSGVYHSGESWNYVKPTPVATLEKKEKKIKSPKKEKVAEPEDPETKEVRLIARIRTETEEDLVAEPIVKEKKPKKESSGLGFFSKTAKTTKTVRYPETSEAFTGELDTTDRTHDLEGSSFEHVEIPAYAPKKVDGKTAEVSIKTTEHEEPEKKEVRLIAYVKSEPDDETVERAVKEKKPRKETTRFGFFSKTTKTTGYPSTEAYIGELDTTDRTHDLEGTSFEHGEIPAYSLKKKEVETLEVPAEPEKKRYRLIARWRHEGDEDVAEKPDAYKPSDKMLELYEGPLEDISRESELEHAPIEGVYHSGESWNYAKPSPIATLEKKEKKTKSPKKEKVVEPEEPETKEVRLIARVKSEPVVKEKKPKKEKSSKSGFFSRTTKTTGYPETSDAYTGELDTTARSQDLEKSDFEHVEIPTYAPKKTETTVTVIETTETTEPEKKDVRLIAYVKSEPEEPVAEPVVKEKKPKKEGSSKFGFFSKTTKTTKTTGYPSTEAYTGELDTTDRIHDLETTSFEHGEFPAYAPKKVEASEAPEVPTEPEKKRYRLIARWRHEGEEGVAEKPDAYKPSDKMVELYEGPLDDITRESELEHAPIEGVYHSGESWNYVKAATLEKKEKKIKSSKKEKAAEPEVPETKEVRLIARIKSEPKEEAVEPVVKEKKPKKSKFFHRSPMESPPTSDTFPSFDEPLDPHDELESPRFEYFEYTPSKPNKAEQTEVVEEKKPSRRFNWFARWRHEGDEDVVEKPNSYAFSSDVYDGALEDLYHQGDIDHALITEYSNVYECTAYHPKKQEKVKTPEPEPTPEPTEVKLVARIQPLEHEESPETSPVKDRTSSFSIFHRHSKQHQHLGYPDPTPAYTGNLQVTGRSEDVEKAPFEMRTDIPEYSPKKDTPAESPIQRRLHRLFARWRHEGEEDEIEQPDMYHISRDAYQGPLSELHHVGEAEHSPLSEFADTYEYVEYRDGSKKPKSPKASKKREVTPEESESHEVKLRVKSGRSEEPEDDAPETTPSKPFRLRFLSLAKKAPESSEYPEISPIYEGPLDLTSRSDEMEPMPYLYGATPRYSPKFDRGPEKPRLVARVPPQAPEESPEKKEDKASRFRMFNLSKSKLSGYPATSPVYEGTMHTTKKKQCLDHVPIFTREFPPYSPRKSEVTVEKTPEKTSQEEEEPKRYRLIARWRHEGDEDVVEKPDAYEPSKTMMEPFQGRLDELAHGGELVDWPIREFAEVKYDVENFKGEAEPEDQDLEKKSRFSFLRTQQKRASSAYPSTSYSGPLDTTNRKLDLENIPFQIPLNMLASPERPRKHRLIPRIRIGGEEDEVAAHKLHPALYAFPIVHHTGPIDLLLYNDSFKGVPIERCCKVYHSGSSIVNTWYKMRISRASKDLEELQEEARRDVKLIARVLPMKKGESDEKPPKLTKEEKALAEALAKSAELMDTSRSLTGNLNAINYIPSTLTFPAPRPARIEGTTDSGDCYVEVRHERRAEVQIEPVYMLCEAEARSHAYLSTATATFSGVSFSPEVWQPPAPEPGVSHSVVQPTFVGSISEDERGLHNFSWTPVQMSPQPTEKMSLLARLGFKRDKTKKKDKNKKAINGDDKKGEHETSGETSDSEHDEKRDFAIVEFEQHAPSTQQMNPSPPKKPEHRTHKSPGRRADEPMNEVTVVVTSSERPKELKNTKEVRHETREQQFRLTGDGYTSGFNPNDPSLMATIQRAERLNASSPRLEHAERTFTVRANAPLPVSFEESGQPYTTVSTWQETSDLPEQVEVYTDENGRQITRTVKSSQVKHTVQTQSFQNYIVDGDQVPVGVVDVERSREQLTPLGQKASSSSSGAIEAQNGGDSTGIVETQTRTMTYEAQGGENAAPPGWAEQGLGEYVSSKSVTQGNRTIETITYKTEKDGVVETHVEHRVTIHSDGDIDHDAELSQAILEATQMNPDMVVEKIEVRQETTQ